MKKIMNTGLILVFFLAVLLPLSGEGQKEKSSAEIKEGGFTLKLTPGEEWIHSFSALIKVPPQYALWIEDSQGHYLETIYVTKKAATEGWAFNKGNRRDEALPRWSHQRNITDSEGHLLPSKKEPLPDSISGATPRKASSISVGFPDNEGSYIICLEINHSTDFNERWPRDAEPGTPGWTGGSEGSGQPSLLYTAEVHPEQTAPLPLTLTGYGSPDGSSGEINRGFEDFGTALKILESAVLESTESQE